MILNFYILFSLLFLVTLLMSFSDKLYTRKKNRLCKFFGLLGISIIILYVVYRPYGGKDFFSYKNFYENGYFDIAGYSMESGMKFVMKLLSNITLDYKILLLFFGISTWGLIYTSVKRFNNSKSFIFFVFITFDFLLFSLNGARQAVSIAILFYVWFLLESKKYFWSVILVILAISIHKSAIFVLPFFFLPKIISPSRSLWFFIYIGSYFSGLLLSFFIVDISNLLPSAYSNYAVRIIEDVEQSGVLGYFIHYKIILGILLLYYSDKVLKYYPRLKGVFVMSFLSFSILMIFGSMNELNRMNFYFWIFNSISFGYLLKVLLYEKNYVPFLTIVFSLIIYLGLSIYIGSAGINYIPQI